MGRGKKRNMLSSKSAKRIIFRNSQVMSSPQIDEGSLEVSGIEIMNDQITAKSSSSRKRQIDGITCSANENIIQIDDASSCEQFKEISSSSSSENDTNDRTNVTGCYQIDDRVHLVVQRWGNVSAIAPDLFLLKLLEARGFETRRISAMDSSYRRRPTTKQLDDYSRELVTAVRKSDITSLKKLASEGKSMVACNKFCESIVHMACRQSSFEVVDFVLSHVETDKWLVDDFGRTPLHDACWRSEPRFDVVTIILDRNLDLLRVEDIRGALPLNYVRQDQWLQWCAYFFHQKEKYWAVLA